MQLESASYLYDWKNGPLQEERRKFLHFSWLQNEGGRQLAHGSNFMTILASGALDIHLSK